MATIEPETSLNAVRGKVTHNFIRAIVAQTLQLPVASGKPILTQGVCVQLPLVMQN